MEGFAADEGSEQFGIGGEVGKGILTHTVVEGFCA
jgi:hypothetical protein